MSIFGEIAAGILVGILVGMTLMWLFHRLKQWYILIIILATVLILITPKSVLIQDFSIDWLFYISEFVGTILGAILEEPLEKKWYKK